jgi:hypothetical protein
MQTTKVNTSGQAGEERNLHHRYGKIGISAVAAAVRYCGDAKNTAYAPVIPRRSERDSEAA